MESESFEYVALNNGVDMPMLGFGTLNVTDLRECENMVIEAISLGYRMVDTAAAYGNEKFIGSAIRKSGVDREKLFLTTKLWIQDAGYEKAKKAFERSCKNLGTDYLDLYLIHQPFGDYYGAWRALEELYHEKRVRAIGVCNFSPDRLTDLCIYGEEIPCVNQVELHPFLHSMDGLSVMESFGVQAEAWGPLSEGGHGIFTHPVLSAVGEKYGKSAAQIALRWNIQRGVVVIPKSVKRKHLKENMEIMDFSLSKEDMEKIRELDIGHSEIIDHRRPSTVRMLSKFRLQEPEQKMAL